MQVSILISLFLVIINFSLDVHYPAPAKKYDCRPLSRGCMSLVLYGIVTALAELIKALKNAKIYPQTFG